jgi:hypothetical protein
MGLFNREGDDNIVQLDYLTVTSFGPTVAIRVQQVEVCWDSQPANTYQLQYKSALIANLRDKPWRLRARRWHNPLRSGSPSTWRATETLSRYNSAVMLPARNLRLVASADEGINAVLIFF